jgi:hypothetical protein
MEPRVTAPSPKRKPTSSKFRQDAQKVQTPKAPAEPRDGFALSQKDHFPTVRRFGETADWFCGGISILELKHFGLPVRFEFDLFDNKICHLKQMSLHFW